MANYLKNTKIDSFYTSTLQRANVTGKKIAEAQSKGVTTDERLVEIDYGDWTNQFRKDLKENQKELYQKWTDTPWLCQIPNGETLEMLGNRGAEALHDIAQKNEGKTVFVAAHSLLNKATICELLGLGQEHCEQFNQDNTSISVLQYDGKWSLTMWNAIPHLNQVTKGIPLN